MTATKNDDLFKQFKTLVEIVSTLRSPQGCPWDLAQTQKSLTQYAIEEAFELAEAIETQNQTEVCEELGDFLFQVILQAQVAEDEGKFDLNDVLRKLSEKMIARHPHVFSGTSPSSLEEIWKKWHQQKRAEKPEKKRIFSYPVNLPALQAANKIGIQSKAFGFDWPSLEGVLNKVREETAELEEALLTADRQKISHELGDLLFSIAQLARHLEIEPEQALRSHNRRFQMRFEKTVELAGGDREAFLRLPSSQKEALWQEAKKVVQDAERLL